MNKNTKIIVGLLVITLISAIGLFYFLNTSKTASISEPDDASTGSECHDSSQYFAIQKNLTDAVGSNILIKYKTSPNTTFPCAYVVSNDDFEIKNVSAGYFLTFTDNFLVLDSGTGPSYRELIAYDLRTRKVIFTDLYEDPVTVTKDSITYLTHTKTKPTLQNCPELKNYISNGLGAVILSKVTVDLSTATKKVRGVIECIATQ
jgi:hypothetical protein